MNATLTIRPIGQSVLVREQSVYVSDAPESEQQYVPATILECQIVGGRPEYKVLVKDVVYGNYACYRYECEIKELSMANPVNYAIVIKENTEAEDVVCAVSMVETVPCNEQTQLEAFQYVCGQIGVEYGDFDYRFELGSAKYHGSK